MGIGPVIGPGSGTGYRGNLMGPAHPVFGEDSQGNLPQVVIFRTCVYCYLHSLQMSIFFPLHCCATLSCTRSQGLTLMVHPCLECLSDLKVLVDLDHQTDNPMGIQIRTISRLPEEMIICFCSPSSIASQYVFHL